MKNTKDVPAENLANCLLKLFILYSISQRVDAAVDEHHTDSEVVESAVEICRISQVVQCEVNLVERPAYDKAEAHKGQRLHNIFLGTNNRIVSYGSSS